MLLGILLLAFLAALVFTPGLFAVTLFYLLPTGLLSWLGAEILFAACFEDEKKGDLSPLPGVFAATGFLSFILCMGFRFRELGKDGRIQATNFGYWLYEAYNAVNQRFVMFVPIFRPAKYSPVLYDEKSLAWTVAFALCCGMPLAFALIFYFRGHRMFSSLESRARKDLTAAKEEKTVLANKLYTAEGVENTLRSELKAAADELRRLREDAAAFQKGSGPAVAPVSDDAGRPSSPTKSDRAGVDSDTL